jgi:hypothetical protein
MLTGTTGEQLPVPLQAPVTQPQRRPTPACIVHYDALRTPAPRQQTVAPAPGIDAVGTLILPGTRYQVSAIPYRRSQHGSADGEFLDTRWPAVCCQPGGVYPQ